MSIVNLDGLLRISLMGGQARAFLAGTTHLCDRARAVHGLGRVATAALGRLLTGSAIMGAMLKGARDSLTVQIKGGGPIGTLLAVAQPDASVKGYVDNPSVDLPRKNGKLDVGGAVGSNGELAVIKDLGLREAYVGRVKLVSGEIAEDLAMYFTASEQTPSLVSLGVLTNERVVAAGGLVIQPMPGCEEITIKSIEAGAYLYTDISGTIAEYGLDGALHQLLAHLEPKVIDRMLPRYACDCSRERMERALVAMGEGELISLIEEQDGAEMSCHFCNRKHRFTGDDLRELLRRAKENETGGEDG